MHSLLWLTGDRHGNRTESHTVLRACHSQTQAHLPNTRPSKCSLNDSKTILSSSFRFANDSLSVYIRSSSVIIAKKSEKYSDEDVWNDTGKPSILFAWLFCISKPKLNTLNVKLKCNRPVVVFSSFECKLLVRSSVPDLPHFVQTLLKYHHWQKHAADWLSIIIAFLISLALI